MNSLRKIANAATNLLGASAMLVAVVAHADITGNVFQDFNSNGVRDTTTTIANAGTTGGTIGAAVDVGLADVSVSAVCVTGRGSDNILGTADDVVTTFGPVATSNVAATLGNYSLPITGAVTPSASETAAGKKACRLSFTWNEAAPLLAGVPNPLFGMRPAFVGTGSNTATQFVDATATNVNLGLNYPSDFCQNNPNLAANCGTFGPASTNTAAALYQFPYSARSNPAGTDAPTPTARASAAQIGSTWGIAYHKQSKNVLVSAYFKRHIGVGPGGVGQIYSVPASGAPTSFVNLETLVPGSTGVDPRTAASDFTRDLAVLDGSNRLLVGKLGIGDIDLSDDNTTLYAIGLASKRLYRMNVGNGVTLTSPTSATTINLPSITDIGTSAATGCPVEGDLRPFALKYNKGFLYVGITCTAESTITDVSQNAANPGGDPTRLRAFVYRMDTTTNAFTQVANFTLNVTARANPDFGAWNNSDNTGQRPQPLVADIEFNGANMLVGVRDRFGDTTGRGTFFFDTNNNSLADGRGHGDTYLACPSAVGIYDPANCATSGFTFYQDDQIDQNSSMGGLAQVPGFPDYVYTKKDPVRIWSSGIGWNNHTSGALTKGYEILFSNPGPQTGNVYNNMGKSSSFGDVEALCDAAPIEIGNRVWFDANFNGIQDPGEPPIAGVTVNLFAPNGTTLLATAVTDANGNYYFNNRTTDADGNALTLTNGGSTVNAITGLTPNTTGYQIRFDNATNYTGAGPLASLGLATPNASGNTTNNALTDLTDSDATLPTPTAAIGAGNFPSITFSTGGAGENNFGLDAGFTPPTFSLGNRIWGDTNNDGIFNNSEVGRADVLVALTDGSGNPLFVTPTGNITSVSSGNTPAQVVTTSDGYYRFDNLPAGDYRVVVDARNWTGFTGSFPTGTLNGGASGFAQPQRPLAGFTSSTPGANGVTGVTSGTGSTNNNDKGINPATAAAYTTAGVSSGSVTLGTSNQPTADVDSTATPAGLNGPRGDASDNLTVDFGLFRLTVGDTLWYDSGAGGGTRNNGLKDGTEAGVPAGVVVELLKGGVVVASTTTDANGNYIFTQQNNLAGATGTVGAPLLPGSDYQVRVPAGQAALAGTSSSTNPASLPTVTSAGAATNDDGDSGAGTADASANATSTANFTLGASASAIFNSADTTGTYPNTQGLANDGTSHKPNVDLGFVPPRFAIGNRVWFDTNNNGVKDAAEANVPGVVIELLDSSSNVIATTSTNATGEYLFDNLNAGVYTVRVAASNWTGITAAQATAAGNAALAGTRPLAGYNNSTPDNAASGPTTVDATDKGIFNSTPAANGILSPPITLAVGNQPLNEDGTADNDGATASSPGDAFDNRAVDFGFYKLSVGNLVFNDNGTGGGTVNNGVRDGTEPGISGVTVQLVNSSNVVVAQTLTDANGNYMFMELTSVPAVGTAGTANGNPIPPGNYTVRLPAGQAPLSNLVSSADPAGGGQPVGDSRDNGAGTTPSTSPINSAVVNLTAAGALPTGATATNSTGTTDQPRMDFAVTPTFSLGNRVYLDIGNGGGTRNNGVQDGAEAGIAAVTMRLLDSTGAQLYRAADGSITTVAAGNTAISTVTDANGYYRFDGLPAGSYTVEVVGSTLPAGAASSTGTQAGDRGDKGIDAPVAGNFRSVPVAVGPGLQPTGEPDIVGTTGASAQGPSGDASTNSTIDFGFNVPVYALGNRVWFDTNNNGIRDAGEAAAAGVIVELLNSSGAVVATRATSATGEYVFDGLGAGQYSVRIPASNWSGITSAQATAVGNAALVGTTPLRGYGNSTPDNAVPGAGAVGAADGTDKGITNASPATNGIVSPTVTLGAGLQPTGENGAAGDTDPATVGLDGDGNDNMAIDFGFYRLTVGNQIWIDTNGNSVYNPGVDATPASVQGITVELRDAATNAVIATTTTQPDGTYQFVSTTNGNPIPPGSYYVSLPTLPPGTRPTPLGTALTDNNNQGSVPASPIAGVAVRSGDFTLVPGATTNGQTVTTATGTTVQPTLDIGFFATYSLGNRVWVDANNNGTIDGGEAGLDGVTVNLLDGNGAQLYRNTTTGVISTSAVGGVAITTTTTTGGYYLFKDLPAGNYTVEVVTPTVGGVSYVSSSGSNGNTTGPFEPATPATAFGNTATNFDHGIQFASNTIRSRPVTLGAGQPTGEDGNVTPGQTDTTPDNQSNLTIDFGVFLPARLGNFVWLDINRDGRADPGEVGINGVAVTLRDGAGNVVATQITRDRPPGETSGNPGPGWYQFTNLIPGSYSVEFNAPGYTSTPSGPPAGTTGTQPEANNNQLPPGVSTGSTAVVTVAAGDNNPQLDAGFTPNQPVPTLSQWSQALLALALLMMMALAFRRQRLASQKR